MLIITSPTLPEFHKKLQTYCNVTLAPNNSYFVLGNHNVVCNCQISSFSLFAEVSWKAKRESKSHMQPTIAHDETH